MNVFAQLDAAGQTLALGGWVGGVASLLLTCVTAYLTYRQGVARMQFDLQMQRLKDRLEYLESELSETREAEDRAIQAEERCRKELAEVRAKLSAVTDYLLRNGVSPADIAGPAK